MVVITVMHYARAILLQLVFKRNRKIRQNRIALILSKLGLNHTKSRLFISRLFKCEGQL